MNSSGAEVPKATIVAPMKSFEKPRALRDERGGVDVQSPPLNQQEEAEGDGAEGQDRQLIIAEFVHGARGLRGFTTVLGGSEVEIGGGGGVPPERQLAGDRAHDRLLVVVEVAVGGADGRCTTRTMSAGPRPGLVAQLADVLERLGLADLGVETRTCRSSS